MTPLIVLGTDTDAGKTTFSLLWLAAFADKFEYWKPLETGDSDSETVRRLVPGVVVHPPLGRFRDPVAPPLAARREGRTIPPAADIARAIPTPTVPGRALLIETFGGPLSPLNDTELQIEWVRRAGATCLLVASSAVGAVGRTLSTLDAMARYGVVPAAVVLLGDRDEYAEAEIRKHRPGVSVVSLRPPARREFGDFSTAAWDQRGELAELQRCIEGVPGPPPPPFPTEQLLAADARCVWHPYSTLRPAVPPLAVVAADAEFFMLADGRRVIDAVSSWWTILHGHRFPLLIDALKAAADRIDHELFAGVTHPDAVRFADLILRTCPWDGGRV
ncbi:MAG: aminotransferase class III-fold pyridoxal phosphate-dependent enzyme, partial [Fimbriiglobus sp.]